MPFVLTAEELRQVDAATIAEEGISSLELMERAAEACANAIYREIPTIASFVSVPIVIFCGRGNNGGDGWVLARWLAQHSFTVTVFDLELGDASPDNAANRSAAQHSSVKVRTLKPGDPLPKIPKESLLIDAVFGTGLNRPVTGHWATLFTTINELPNPVFSVDIPSGVFTDLPTNSIAIKCNCCFSLGYPKLAEFAPENEAFYGEIHRVAFSLSAADQLLKNPRELLEETKVANWLKRRSKFGHKGTYGHALLVAGSHGSIGAAVLAARATLRAGVGKLTCHLPACGYQIVQTTVPEAMCSTDEHVSSISSIPLTSQYTTVGIGPGIGQKAETAAAFLEFLKQVDYPIVVDADALNILGNNPDWITYLPKHSVLTPHPKEFDRLFGSHQNTFARWVTQRSKADELGLTIVLKGGYTSVAAADESFTFNPTGNPGMGTAGMGDVLTGVITALIAQGYSPAVAARLGCYVHGLAGDLGAANNAGVHAERSRGIGAEESLIASDVVDQLGAAFAALHRWH